MKRAPSELCATHQFPAAYYRFARALPFKNSYRAGATSTHMSSDRRVPGKPGESLQVNGAGWRMMASR